MPRATSPFSRGVIISNRVSNKSIKECQYQLELIYQQQGQQKSCSYDTISRIYKLWDSTKNVETSYQNCGGKPIISQKQEKKIIQSFKKNPKQSLRQAANNETVNIQQVSHTLIQKVTHKNNLRAFKIPTIQMITQDQKRQRLEFCQSVKYWTAKWKTVIFTDEIMIEKGLVGNKFIWKEQRSHIKHNECFEKQAYPKNRLHLWGAITYEKGLSLLKIEGTLNSESYCKILQTFINEQDDDFFEGKIFQQDRASSHTAKKTLKFIEDNNLKLLQWPPKGADISPIEKIWAMLKEEFNKLDDSLSVEQIYKKLRYEFLNNQKIKLAIQRLYSSLSQKIKDVISNKGNQINI